MTGMGEVWDQTSGLRYGSALSKKIDWALVAALLLCSPSVPALGKWVDPALLSRSDS